MILIHMVLSGGRRLCNVSMSSAFSIPTCESEWTGLKQCVLEFSLQLQQFDGNNIDRVYPVHCPRVLPSSNFFVFHTRSLALACALGDIAGSSASVEY